jgi:hypothetical protein
MAQLEIEVTAWDPTALEPDCTLLIVAKRNAGKSVLMRDIFYHMRNKLDLVVGMSPSEPANHSLEMFIPKALIFPCFSDDKLSHLLEWQRRCVANDKAMKLGFVMDDCMSEQTAGAGGKKKKVMGSSDINKVFKMGRHLKLFYVNLMQYIKDAPPDIRGNVDYLFVFNTPSNSEREKLYKDYFGMFKSFRDFCRVFDVCATGYDCLVLNMRNTGTPSIHYYRASYRTHPFRVGRAVFQQLSQYYYEDRADYDMDPSKVLGVRSDAFGAPLDTDDEPARSRRTGEISVIKR